MPAQTLNLIVTRAAEITPEIVAAVERTFAYQPWDAEMIQRGEAVRRALADAVLVIIASVPPGPTRTRALNMCVDARMLANAAITFRGEV
jgi:hypothetical protein